MTQLSHSHHKRMRHSTSKAKEAQTRLTFGLEVAVSSAVAITDLLALWT
jgi:hypothetical protein